jgi:hypothetical protein
MKPFIAKALSFLDRERIIISVILSILIIFFAWKHAAVRACNERAVNLVTEDDIDSVSEAKIKYDLVFKTCMGRKGFD